MMAEEMTLEELMKCFEEIPDDEILSITFLEDDDDGDKGHQPETV